MPRNGLIGIPAGDLPWQPFAGMPGLSVITLSDDLDEVSGSGSRTRLVRFDRGARTGFVLEHGYWEEVLCLSGSLQDADSQSIGSMNYVKRPPGTPHGPFHSTEGCVLVEFQYFAPSC
ncbi:cupin [Pseudooceanicola sp. 216_PA32_1]|uniref:Cupin n=1 Tax=Pseudooceanicola pacificus TaxID=2676438 RepID=A0A844W0E3_9RHOB|nr:cupin domain-containing protein [Pseudooceanicola pacificus]MWB77536.1 cupin [Pseudooceanicola pacificus]